MSAANEYNHKAKNNGTIHQLVLVGTPWIHKSKKHWEKNNILGSKTKKPLEITKSKKNNISGKMASQNPKNCFWCFLWKHKKTKIQFLGSLIFPEILFFLFFFVFSLAVFVFLLFFFVFFVFP